MCFAAASIRTCTRFYKIKPTARNEIRHCHLHAEHVTHALSMRRCQNGSSRRRWMAKKIRRRSIRNTNISNNSQRESKYVIKFLLSHSVLFSICDDEILFKFGTKFLRIEMNAKRQRTHPAHASVQRNAESYLEHPNKYSTYCILYPTKCRQMVGGDRCAADERFPLISVLSDDATATEKSIKIL